jgi:hypothetical protein
MKVGSVRIVNPAKRISTVAFPIKNIDPVFGCVEDDDVLMEEEEEEEDDDVLMEEEEEEEDDDVLMEEEEEEEEDVVGSIISFVVLNMMVSTQFLSL